MAAASGLPFGLVTETLPVLLRTRGASLAAVGDLSAAQLPWTLKFLWAPLVDRIGRRRAWIVGCLVGICLLLLPFRTLDPTAPGAGFWLALLALVALSATQDIAIDAYTVESTRREELGTANAVRIGTYRAAMFVGGGSLVALAGLVSWDAALAAAATVLLLLACIAWRSPEYRPLPGGPAPDLGAPLRELLGRPGIAPVLAFALLFKLGDALLDPMARAFWVDRGLSPAEIGGPVTTGRLVGTTLGAVIGGVLTSRLGLRRGLLGFGALQALSNAGYWWAASTGAGLGGIVAVAVLENLCGGLGTAAFVAYLMSVCDRRFAATQYALLSAALAATRALAGPLAGRLDERLGHPAFFALTLALAFPALLLVPGLSRATPPADAPPPAA
ncbi:MAG: MFS transporter [Gemmatimonadales bacterium]|nr:MFS transporter [Gemmatimonadales bacterium]